MLARILDGVHRLGRASPLFWHHCRRHGLMSGLTAIGRVEQDTRCGARPVECGKSAAGRSASRHGNFSC